MTLNDYTKIAIRRGTFNKKGLLHVLTSFFHVSEIHHDAACKTYYFDSALFSRFSESDLYIFNKLIKKFSCYNELFDNKFIIRYNW